MQVVEVEVEVEQKTNFTKHLRCHTSERCVKIFLSNSYNSIEEQYGILRCERSGRQYSSMKSYTQNDFSDVTLACEDLLFKTHKVFLPKYWDINSIQKWDKQSFIFQVFWLFFKFKGAAVNM